MSESPPKPDKPCQVCGSDWYWPGDYYLGKKEWVCQRCHPPPDSHVVVENVAVPVEG